MFCVDNNEREKCTHRDTTSSCAAGVTTPASSWQQSPFCDRRLASFSDEVIRYLVYDRHFFSTYSVAILSFFSATVVFFFLGSAGSPVKDPTRMTQFVSSIQRTLDEKSLGSGTKLSSIRSASRDDFLKSYRYQMFGFLDKLDVRGLVKAIRSQSERVLGILMKSVTKPDYTCESFEKALDSSWVLEGKHPIDKLMNRAVKSINESGVLPFYTKLGEQEDKTCVELSPKIIESAEFDLIPQLINDKQYFCPGTRSGTISGDVLSSIVEELPAFDIKTCGKGFITKWNGLLASLAADAPVERRPLFHAMLFESIRHTGSFKAPERLSTLQSVGIWLLVARDRCSFSAWKAIAETGLDDKRFKEGASEASVLAALDKLAEHSRLGACEEVFVNIFVKILAG